MLLFIGTHRWIKPHMAFSLCSSKLPLPEGTLQFRQHEHALFPAFWKLNYKVLLLLSAIVSSLCPSTNLSAFTSLFSEWCLILTVTKKGHLIVSPTWMKHSYCIYPAGQIFPAQFCSQSKRTKFIKQAVWSSPELEDKGQKERYRETRASDTIYFYCI